MRPDQLHNLHGSTPRLALRKCSVSMSLAAEALWIEIDPIPVHGSSSAHGTQKFFDLAFEANALTGNRLSCRKYLR